MQSLFMYITVYADAQYISTIYAIG